MKKILLLLSILSPVFIFSVAASAAEPGLGDERTNIAVRDEEFAQNIEQIKLSEKDASRRPGAAGQEWDLRYGGWVTSTYREYHNIDNEEVKEDFLKWSWQQDVYLWAQMRYRQAYTLYARVANSYIDRDTGPDYTGIGADNEGPSLNVLYLQLDMDRDLHVPAKVTLGRQYLYIGRGVVYANIHDGALVEVAEGDFYAKSFISRTRPYEDNIDFSVPGFDKRGKRMFIGGELAYLGISNAAVYAFGLYQEDLNNDNLDNTGQNYHYDSYYYGGGFSSEPVERLEIWSEIIFERGSSYTDVVRSPLIETTIESWGMVTGGKYRFDAWSRPIVEAEYARGTGDGQRARVTNVNTGGDNDGHDRNFLYFGYYLAGYALNPRLSNINIASVGGSFQPLVDLSVPDLLKKVALGTKYYRYWKDEQRAGTSDFESIDTDSDIGDEIDFYLHWKINDNLRASIRYGIFYPGQAFPEATDDKTKFFSGSMTWSF